MHLSIAQQGFFSCSSPFSENQLPEPIQEKSTLNSESGNENCRPGFRLVAICLDHEKGTKKGPVWRHMSSGAAREELRRSERTKIDAALLRTGHCGNPKPRG